MQHLVKIDVGGLVQGVGFRYFVESNAKKYGLKGYVKNLYNGDVEIEVEGEDVILKQFVEEVKIGPRFAQVKSFFLDYMQYEGKYNKFEVRY
jgi:acylphosphatase